MQIFYQSNVPVNQNLLYQTEEAAKDAPTGDMDIQYDTKTGFIYNNAFDHNKVTYMADYDNNQHYSSFFSAYIDAQIEWLIKKYIQQNSIVAEVGCGKGYYIKKIAQKISNCKAYGFDTSYVQDSTECPPNLCFFNEYYDNKYTYLRPNIIICRHVIEHIHNPFEFLSGIRASMPENALLFLETPDVNWILKNTVIFDFFYEHCSYWNRFSLEAALTTSGFEPIEMRYAFKGQYMWIVARATKSKNSQHRNTNHIQRLCRTFSDNRDKKINAITLKLQKLTKMKEPVFIWGAGAKGVTFVNLFDIQKDSISALIDINPGKQNKYVGVTAHKVISPKQIQMNNRGGGRIVILNSNYTLEIKKALLSMNLHKKFKLDTIY